MYRADTTTRIDTMSRNTIEYFFIKLSSERSFFIKKKANFSMEIHMRYSLYKIIGEMDVIERFDSKRNHILIE